MVLNRYLLDRLCSCLFMCGSDHALEEAFLFLRSGFGLAVQSLDIQYIDTADNGLYFLFHGNIFEDLLITDQGYDVRANLCLDDGKLGTTHPLCCLIDHHLLKTGIFHFHAFLINYQHP